LQWERVEGFILHAWSEGKTIAEIVEMLQNDENFQVRYTLWKILETDLVNVP
jgi:predicted MarR family transcription regulator